MEIKYELYDVEDQQTEFIGTKEEIKEYLFQVFLKGRNDLEIYEIDFEERK
jgi:hypothetical protein